MTNKNLSRRGLIAATSVASVGAFTNAKAMTSDLNVDEVATENPDEAISFEPVMQVLAKTGEAIDVDGNYNGGRRIVPIVGGSFSGPGMRGVVLPGGADRQRIRNDGIKELDALYDLRADDGTVFTVHNQAIIDASNQENGRKRYVRSVVKVTAPKGPHDWLNRKILIGTLFSLRPSKPFVLVRFYAVS